MRDPVGLAAKTMTKTAISAINAPAKQGRWGARSVYKGCEKIIYGKAKYKEMKKVKVERALREAQEAAKYAEAWQQSAAQGKNRWRRASQHRPRPDTPSKMSDIAESPSASASEPTNLARQESDASTVSIPQRSLSQRPVTFEEAPAVEPETPR